MKYVFDTPIQAGDLSNPITIDALELASFAANFEPYYSDQGKAVVSIVLIHRASGYTMNIVYQDASALGLWESIEGTGKVISLAIFNKLMTDAKLPAGNLSQ